MSSSRWRSRSRSRSRSPITGRGDPPASRLRLVDTVTGAGSALASRPVRVALSAVGIAIGIGAAVAVVGISSSSRADLLARLGAEGNLLTVASGQTIDGQPAPLPVTAPGMIRVVAHVEAVAAVGYVPGATVRRSAAIPALDSGGISVLAADANLPATVDARVAHGTFLNLATERYPAVVLGDGAARTLGINVVSLATQVFVGGRYFTVVGILAPVAIAPEIDDAALVGFPEARTDLGLGSHSTRIYLRAQPDQVPAVARLLAFTANPEQPESVQVSRPSDVLAARLATGTAFTSLLLGVGAVAVVVGAVGIANVMVIEVLERRSEIGLRRALGATRGHVARQFLAESSLLAAIGGGAGVVLGSAATAVYARVDAQPGTVPLRAGIGGLVMAVLIGTLAGVYPAARAAQLAPTEALRSP